MPHTTNGALLAHAMPAFVPTPLFVPAAPPTSAHAVPSGSTATTRWFVTTNAVPLVALTATAYGDVSSAAVPTPLASPASAPVAPPPMTVVTAPVSCTRRIAWLPVSQTRSILLKVEKPTPQGVLKSAAVPAPFASAEPASTPVAPPPATVVTAPVARLTARRR